MPAQTAPQKAPSHARLMRVAMPLVAAELDWQRIAEDVKDELDMDATDDNLDLIMDAIRDCEFELFEKLD